MKIGIVSDSHGKTNRLQSALDIFAERSVEAIVHCGDIISARCVALLAAADAETYLVLGNMDRHSDQLIRQAAKCGVNFSWEVIEVPIDAERHLVATHGNDEKILGEIIAKQQFPYVCHGHTHRVRDERIGKVRVINPGALYNNRDPSYPTVAVLDTETNTLETIRLPD